jgi:hypothetical protein
MGFHSSTPAVTNFRRGGVYLSDGVAVQDKDGVWQGIGTKHQYRLLLLSAKTIEDTAKASIYDVEILESTWKGSPVGSHASIYFNYSGKAAQAAKRDEIMLVGACCGIEPNDEKRLLEVCTNEYLDYVTSKDNPFAEFKIILPCTTMTTLTKANKVPFTKHFFGVAKNPVPT